MRFYEKHGMNRTPLHYVWVKMKDRCHNPKYKQYYNYGGRGIIVCDEWRYSFKAFHKWAMANGYKKGLSVDRIDNNGNYEPCNCKFATRAQQSRNMRTNVFIEYNGRVQCFTDWCIELNIPYLRTFMRVNKLGWSIKDAFEAPKNTKKSQLNMTS